MKSEQFKDEHDRYVEGLSQSEIYNELYTYATLDNTEFGEMSLALLKLIGVSHYGLSDTAIKALEEEMRETLAAYHRTTRLITHTRMIEERYQELEYDWEWEEE